MDNAVSPRTIVVAGAGASLTADQLEHIRGKAYLIVANNAYHLAPWADALVACDSKWWTHYGKDARAFAGRKFSHNIIGGVEYFKAPDQPIGCNSGLYGMLLARHFKAERILLLGFDMHGSHFFGLHPTPLKNQDARRFADHLAQFKRFKGPLVVNCTPHSALKLYELSSIFKEL